MLVIISTNNSISCIDNELSKIENGRIGFLRGIPTTSNNKNKILALINYSVYESCLKNRKFKMVPVNIDRSIIPRECHSGSLVFTCEFFNSEELLDISRFVINNIMNFYNYNFKYNIYKYKKSNLSYLFENNIKIEDYVIITFDNVSFDKILNIKFCLNRYPLSKNKKWRISRCFWTKI